MKKVALILIMSFMLVGCTQNTEPYVAPKIDEMDMNPQLSDEENILKALRLIGVNKEDYLLKSISEMTNTVIIFQPQSPLQTVSAYEINMEKLSEHDFDVETYIQTDETQPVLLGENLTKDDVIVILAWVPEGIPSNYLKWNASDDHSDYEVLQYNGKGE